MKHRREMNEIINENKQKLILWGGGGINEIDKPLAR